LPPDTDSRILHFEVQNAVHGAGRRIFNKPKKSKRAARLIKQLKDLGVTVREVKEDKKAC
jgi:DNA-binding transcriptional MerR regulator